MRRVCSSEDGGMKESIYCGEIKGSGFLGTIRDLRRRETVTKKLGCWCGKDQESVEI